MITDRQNIYFLQKDDDHIQVHLASTGEFLGTVGGTMETLWKTLTGKEHNV
jgi:hypothetical protein